MAQKPAQHPNILRALHLDLAHREVLWKERRDPLAAWSAWRLCREYEIEPPPWLLVYFDECAEGILVAWDSMRDRPTRDARRGGKATPQQRDAAVARAFGFKRAGRESWLSNRLSLAGGMWAEYQAERSRGVGYDAALATVAERHGYSDRKVKREIALWKRVTPWAGPIDREAVAIGRALKRRDRSRR